VDALLRIAVMNTLGATALAVLALVAGRWCRRPAIVHGLWLLVLLKLVTPPFVDVPVPWLERTPAAAATEAPPPAPMPQEAPAQPAEPGLPPVAKAPGALPAAMVDDEEDLMPPEPPPARAEVPEGPVAGPVVWQLPAVDLGWRESLCLLWLVGSVGWFTLAGYRASRFNRLLAHGRPAPAELQGRTWRLAVRLGLHTCPEVVLLPARVAPLLWAVGGRVLLCLPEGLVRALEPAALDTLIAHELAHFRRHDHWVRAAEFVTLGLYWWNPVAWCARRRLREAEEECCDAWVVAALPGMGRTYASALVDTLEFLADEPRAAPLAASGIGGVSDLKRRLTMIMRGTTPRALGWAGALLLAGLVAVLPMWPRPAEARAADEDDPPARVGRDEQGMREELQRLERDLRQKLEEVKALERRLRSANTESDTARRRVQDAMTKVREEARHQARIAAEKARAEAAKARAEATATRQRAQKELARSRAAAEERREGEAGREDRSGGRSRIRLEIVCTAEQARAVQEKVQELRHELPSGVSVHIDIHSERARGRTARPVPPAPPTSRTLPPRPGAGPGGPPPGVRRPGPAGGPPDDRRIDALERRLDLLLRELESMRREIRESRPDRPGRPGRPPSPPPPPDRDPDPPR
jgi:beta-lactamase regulating signal transducer with metallopeptidase domain